MKILAIDTSCDETSVALTEGQHILSNVISSQVRQHRKFGGVVPFLAQRLHTERIDAVVSLALERARIPATAVEAVAVTYGPGLAPALQVGIAKAKELAVSWQVPLYAVNHMAGHFASVFTSQVPQYPVLAVLVSGGHSEIDLFHSFQQVEILGQTLDDALGEAYDKVAKLLDLGYPGGREVAMRATRGEPNHFSLPIPMQRSGDLNLSYSGLKTAVKREVDGKVLSETEKANLCASFEVAAQTSLLNKLEQALSNHPEVQQLVLAGGVAANQRLRRSVRSLAKKHNLSLLLPVNRRLCTDNAAMIGLASYFGMQEGQKPVEMTQLDRIPYLSLQSLPVT